MDLSFVKRQKMAKIRAFDVSCVVIPPSQRSLSQDGLSVFGLQIFFFSLSHSCCKWAPGKEKIPLRLVRRKQLYDALHTRLRDPPLFGHVTFMLIAGGEKRAPYVLFIYAYQISPRHTVAVCLHATY